MSLVVVPILPFGWEMQTCRWHYENEKRLVGLIWMYVLALRGAHSNFYTHLQQPQNFLWVNLINQKPLLHTFCFQFWGKIYTVDFTHLLHTSHPNFIHCNAILACILKLCLQKNWVLVLQANSYAKAHISGVPLDFVTTSKKKKRKKCKKKV